MITVEVTGKLPQINTDLTEAFAKAGEVMEEGIRETWNTSGRGRWPVLRSGQRATLKGKNARMYNALEHKSGSDFAEAGVYGVPYARYQQFGANPTVTAKSKRYFWAMFYGTGDQSWKYMALMPIGRRIHIPPRAFATWEPEMVDEVLKIFAKEVLTFTDAKDIRADKPA